jgi:tetratricopeptide (TPR) repeat protein
MEREKEFHKRKEHKEEHDHNHGASCRHAPQRISKLDRLIMLFLAIILSAIFLRPLISYQSYMRGYSYTELGKPEQAIKHLKKSIMLNEKNDQAWSLLAYNLNKTGNKKESLKAYEKTLQLNPEDFQAAIEYALIEFNDKDYASARRILKKYLKKQADLVDGWLLLARTYEKTGDTTAAVKIYREIYEKIDPGNKVAEGKLREYNKL